MSGKRPQRIEQIYHDARERHPAERAAFLEQACFGDESLQREVESLLAKDGVTPTALKPLFDSTVTRLSIGAHVGPYLIDAVIGAGGMGEVFRAVDTRLGRKVA